MAQTVSTSSFREWWMSRAPELQVHSSVESPKQAEDTTSPSSEHDSQLEQVVYLLTTTTDFFKRLKGKREWMGIRLEWFTSSDQLLRAWGSKTPDLLVLDQEHFADYIHDSVEKRIPIIVFEHESDTRLAVETMKQGAFDVFPLPADMNQFIASMREALNERTSYKTRLEFRNEILERFSSLTRREKEIMSLVLDGMSNRKIADTLSISLRTVEAHRSKILKKMQVKKTVELISIARDADLLPDE